MKKILALGIAGGLLASSIGLSGVVETNASTEVAPQVIQQQSKAMTQILDIHKQLAEIEANEDAKGVWGDKVSELGPIDLENDFDYIDEKTGLGFYYNAETGEYVNKLLTIKIDVNTDKIYDMKTGEELTSIIDINDLLFVYDPKVDIHISVDNRPEKFFELLHDELGYVPNVISDDSSN
ncbi:hypothetical protein [Chengkuizengella axinellae]|uniref:DUF4309 domain-containing protein n=1 Tax=Chengkuizengella axinellae TaxID=3064388 RepID=A0ABT9J078_9BACL|nr:hypothetical protein [Chengkuizengella sp. 2205SS18-9]MDP5275029.1 hypothetical protein [Chengkuizengella sp. 2205SS18-9]